MKVIGAVLLHSLDGYVIDKIYYYKSFFDVGQGDIVVAKLNGDMRLLKVVEVDIEHITPADYIIQVVNTKAYDAYRERDQKLRDLRQAMANRLADMDVMEVYEILAEEDHIMYDLLADYKSIKSR